MRPMFLLLAHGVLAAAAFAQGGADGPAVAARAARARAGLAAVAPLVGRWEGEATTTQRTGPFKVWQSEDVVWGAAQTVLFIRGTGRGVEGPRAGEIVFEAAASMWYDPDSNNVHFRTHRDGQILDVIAELRPDTLVWGFPVPGGSIRYVIAFGNDKWHEVGHFNRPGGAPVKILDMTLSRKP